MDLYALTLSDFDLELLIGILKEVHSVTCDVSEEEKMDVLDAYCERHQIQVQTQLFGGYQYH